jgi:hypothetical protein
MDHVESWTGERQGEGVWLGERSRRRELRKPQTTHVSGDPDAPAGTPEARRTAIPTSTRAIADAMIAQDARLQPRSQSAVGRRFTVAEAEARARRLSHPDYSGETMRERAKRIRQIQPRQRQPVQLSNAMPDVEDLYGPLNDSLGAITLSTGEPDAWLLRRRGRTAERARRHKPLPGIQHQFRHVLTDHVGDGTSRAAPIAALTPGTMS